MERNAPLFGEDPCYKSYKTHRKLNSLEDFTALSELMPQLLSLRLLEARDGSDEENKVSLHAYALSHKNSLSHFHPLINPFPTPTPTSFV